LKVIEDAEFVLYVTVGATGKVNTALYVADAVDPFPFTAVSVNGPYVVPPLVAKLYDVPPIPVIAGTILYPESV